MCEIRHWLSFEYHIYLDFLLYKILFLSLFFMYQYNLYESVKYNINLSGSCYN